MASMAQTLKRVNRKIKRINRKIQRTKAKVNAHIDSAQKVIDKIFPPSTK